MTLERGRRDRFRELKLLNLPFPSFRQALYQDAVPEKQFNNCFLGSGNQISGRESGGAGGFETVVDGKVYDLKLRRLFAVVYLNARSDLFQRDWFDAALGHFKPDS